MAIGFIVGILMVVFAIVAFCVAGWSASEDKGVTCFAATLVGIALVIAFIFVPFSFHTVSSGEVAVVKHLGKIEDVKTAGTQEAKVFLGFGRREDMAFVGHGPYVLLEVL